MSDTQPNNDFLQVLRTMSPRRPIAARLALSTFDPFDPHPADQRFLDRVSAAIARQTAATKEREQRWATLQSLTLVRRPRGWLVRIAEGRTAVVEKETEEWYGTLDEAVGAVMEWFYPEGAE